MAEAQRHEEVEERDHVGGVGRWEEEPHVQEVMLLPRGPRQPPLSAWPAPGRGDPERRSRCS